MYMYKYVRPCRQGMHIRMYIGMCTHVIHLCRSEGSSADYNGQTLDIGHFSGQNQLMTEQKHRCSDIVADQMQHEALC